MQLVFERPRLPTSDEVFDSLIVALIPWLETKGIMKDEVLVDGRLKPLFDVCLPAKEI